MGLPACGREFGFRQAHVCVPPLSVDAYFAARPPYERPIFEAVRDHVTSLGPVIVEPVNIGILFKARRTFAELRPKTRWVGLTLRTGAAAGARAHHPDGSHARPAAAGTARG